MSRIDLPATLHDLSGPELAGEIADRRWQKWSSMCQLHAIGLPVLNAIFVRPTSQAKALGRAARALSAATGASRLMVRSDGGVERKAYYRGGNVFPMEAIEDEASPLLTGGRAVILVEPTNRFDNPLTVMLRLERPKPRTPGTLTLEALGPGYDVGDLTRGGLHPQVTVSCHGVDWSRFEALWWSDIRVARNMAPEAEAENLAARLDNVARHLRVRGELPEGGDDPATAAELWLRQRGLPLLWSGRDPTFDVLRLVHRLHEDAYLVGRTNCNQAWICLGLAFSILGNGRTIYWDVVDGGHKYVLPRHGVA